MENIVISVLLEKTGGAFGITLAALIIVIWASVKISNTINKFSNKIDNYDEKTKEHDKRLNETENNIEEIKSDLIETKTKVNLMYDMLQKSNLAKELSPLSLTDRGKDLGTKMNAEALIDKYEKELRQLIDPAKIYNAYDIQTEAFRLVNTELLKLLNAVELDIIKDVAFNTSRSIDSLMIIFALIFRDKVLKERNIPTSDIDKHTPKAQ
ncbi:MAG: hypothetical protein LBT79_03280 [Elusimicrobiota bacterium]|jgi:ABC-type Fe3+-citrate transport system substrate-binding protein|nr:hypothetical protein [Elusimicrobiota bacterium]